MDKIADTLTTLLNAQKVGKKHVALPYSHFQHDLLQFLQQKGFVAKVRLQESPKAKIVVTLSSGKDAPRVHGVRRLSKPGRRLYAEGKKIPYTASGQGLVVVSTSRGLMDGSQARQEGIGGELICEVW